MHRIGVLAVVVGFLGLCAAVAVLLWPLHGNGVSGSALMPRYSHYIGLTAFGPLPDHPTAADLRRAGVRLPQDVVAHRQHIGFGVLVGAVGVGAVGAALILVGRSREPQAE